MLVRIQRASAWDRDEQPVSGAGQCLCGRHWLIEIDDFVAFSKKVGNNIVLGHERRNMGFLWQDPEGKQGIPRVLADINPFEVVHVTIYDDYLE